MPRTQARLLTKIWNDDDFLALEPGPQRTYMFLLSQSNLSHAGLLPLTVKRWARSSAGIDVTTIESDLKVLEDADYVVIDHDTEELLVRTLVRNDGVWKQPKVMQSMVAGIPEIVSEKLRWRLRQELVKINTEDLKPDVRAQVDQLIADAVKALPETPGEGYPQPLPEPPTEPLASPPRATRAQPLPLSSASATTSATGLATNDDPTGRLLIEHSNAYPEPPPSSALIAVKREIMRLVAEGVAEHRIRAGLARLRERRLAASLLPQLVTEISPPTRVATTDQRVSDAIALSNRLREQAP